MWFIFRVDSSWNVLGKTILSQLYTIVMSLLFLPFLLKDPYRVTLLDSLTYKLAWTYTIFNLSYPCVRHFLWWQWTFPYSLRICSILSGNQLVLHSPCDSHKARGVLTAGQCAWLVVWQSLGSCGLKGLVRWKNMEHSWMLLLSVGTKLFHILPCQSAACTGGLLSTTSFTQPPTTTHPPIHRK